MQGSESLDDMEELAPIGRFSFDLETQVISWSPGCFRVHGMDEGDPAPTPEEFQAMMHPDDAARMAELTSAVMRRPQDIPPEGVRMTYRARRPDGAVHDVRFIGRFIDGLWTGVVEDVTEMRAAERALEAHHAVAVALREWEGVDEGGVGLLRRMGSALGYGLGVLWIADVEAERLEARACWCAPQVTADGFVAHTLGATFDRGEGVPGRAWAGGGPIITEDLLPTLAGVRAETAAAAGLRSAIAIPTIDGEPRAVLTFYAQEVIRPSAAMERALTTIGLQLGAFLDRRRAEIGPRQLSDRELEVLRCAAEGFTAQQIADRLYLSVSTVKTHFEHIYEKLGVGDRAAAVAHALRAGLIE